MVFSYNDNHHVGSPKHCFDTKLSRTFLPPWVVVACEEALAKAEMGVEEAKMANELFGVAVDGMGRLEGKFTEPQKQCDELTEKLVK